MYQKNVSSLWKFYQTYSHNLHFRITIFEFNNRKILQTHSHNIHSKISGLVIRFSGRRNCPPARYIQFSSVQFSHSVVSDSLQPHELQHARPPCLSPTPGIYPNPCPSSWWCHPTISSSVVPFSSCPQSFPASGSFPVSQLFASGGQSIGTSASAAVQVVLKSR